MYQSEWTNKNVLHIFPHWNWQPRQKIDVWAYYSNADEVELFVNGKSKGVKSKQNDEMHVVWNVTFEPGTLKAVSRKDGKIVLEKEIKTAGESSQISLVADRAEISADGEDLSFVTVEILDEDGNFVPTADNKIDFNLEGRGKIVGVDNGNPVSHESFKGETIKAFNGKCLVVVQAGDTEENLKLTASANGLVSNTMKIKIK
jgi:beta-galactosidase